MADGGKFEFENNKDLKKNAELDYERKEDLEMNKEERSNEEYTFMGRKPEHGSISENILEFFYSYGYNCRKYFNLCVVDTNTIAFAAGNLIQFFNVEENRMWFKIGSAGTGIGHISKNSAFKHIAVGTNGENPVISIFNWPNMECITVLKGGTTKRYFHLSYSPDGLLLVSQGGEPDYYISLWNWKESNIILQCKSHVQDVYNVTFSKYIPGQLTSSGVGHIKFWKMSKTFTGLKLKGEIGKFGNTEISDIIAIHPMPDETVVSGCEWGNILLWDESLIKLEACRKNRETAHVGYITQFEYINGELMSIGSDGWIRFWFYETIDHADLSDDEQFLEIQPIYEFQIAEENENAMLMSIQKQEPNSEKTMWYAQDGNGGVWLLDLCTSKKEHVQQKVFTCHAGPVVDMDIADWGPFVATLDKNGNLHIYNYIEKELSLIHKFYDTSRQVIWLPCKIEKTGSTLVCAFENGIVRMITVIIQMSNTAYNIKKDSTKLIQVLKPHSMPITVMSLNAACSLLVTGSDDATIFVFNIHTINNYPTIIPIGYVKIPSSITCMAWNPEEEATLLIGCLKGDCVEIKLPTTPQEYTTTSYELVKCRSASFKFESVKSVIEREAIKKKYEEEKEERLKERRKEMEKLIAENPHIVIDEETFLGELNEKEVILPEIYISEIPNKVLIAQYSINGNIWLFMAGFDAGYVYEYPRPLSGKLKHNKPIRSRIIEHAKDIEIHNFFIQENKKYLYLGTQYGQLYVIKLKEKDPLDFSDFWILQTHDYYNGHISNILLSYNKKILLTCGHDGNIFAFKINDDTSLEEHEVPKLEDSLFIPKSVEDIEDADYPNLEEVITKIEQDRIFAVAEEKKKQILEIIRDLTEEFVKITTRNKYLLHSQQIPQFELDPRIVEDLKQQLNIHTTLTQQKLEFEVEKSKLELQKLMDHFVTPITCVPFAVHGILNEIRAVYSLKELQLDTESILKSIELMKQQDKPLKIEMELQQKVDNVLWEKPTLIIEKQIEEEKHEPEVSEIQYFEAFLDIDFTDVSSGLKIQINQMLSKYKEKKTRMIERQKKWQKLHEKKPDLVKSRFKDAIFLEKAKLAIGEYDLKMNADFSLTRKKETAAIKYKQLIDCRKKLHHLRKNFNTKLKTIALKKQKLQKEVIKLIEVLKRIHTEIPLKNIKPLPHPPKLNLDIEFPEHNLELEKYISISEKMQQVKRQRQSLVIDQFTDHSDLEYEVLYCDDRTIFHKEQENLYISLVPSKIKLKDHLSASDIIRNLNVSDSVQTTWEREMKRSRMWRKIYEQDCILRYIDAEYKKLENELDELEEHRLDVIYQSTYINLNLLTLYEEFIILQESETMEHALEEKVTDKSNECISVRSKMQATNINIVAREEQIKKLHIKIKDIAAEFTKAISDSKFQIFLQKVFKKKYTAIKKQNDTVSQSTETTSDETDKTTDTEAEYIPFDENICPPGCDTQLYEMAFSMREKRYTCEFQIKEEQKEIELLQKELDTDTKYLRVIESTLKNNEEELQNFMLNKQKKLNEVNVTVILKLHQLQHILDSGSTENIQNCIVFNKKELTNLYARVGELQDETHNLEETRKKNETHLKRIKMDLKYMETQNKKLKEYIKEKMIQKFGHKLSLINLYEIILQRLIYDTKTDVNKIMKDFTKDIENAKRSCNEKLIILENLIRNNTEKLSFLTILEKEKFKLRKILEQTLISEENMLQIEHEHKADIVALENILYNQIQQKHMLQYDIESLKTGSKKLPEICLNQNAS
ncbi:cilia- and flagella-associated protein 44 isoform X2 [Frieseomelitta varia]|uniref:cilia- and flagella-associated protein 44 isoform X2 n=1 Tax=Frieseomelitta varia TaxID=561572 RepID=UPI001CB685F5|nr:cilia- and flagella-associated protein 44 isoform X2 [Frieseomelitta varia]